MTLHDNRTRKKINNIYVELGNVKYCGEKNKAEDGSWIMNVRQQDYGFKQSGQRKPYEENDI